MEQNNERFCPACAEVKTNHPETILTVQDHFLSKETFHLLRCGDCGIIYTDPRPAITKIGDYYKSEDYVSHSSSKKGIINRIYGIVRNYTLKQKVELVQQLTSGRNLLDIGAGTGHFLKRSKDAGFQVTGLEPDEQARKVALTENNLQLDELSRLYELNPEQFDAITMWHVLEHVYDLSKDTEQITSLVKANGVLIIAVPNHTSYDAHHYGPFWAGYDVPRHLYHFSPQTIVPYIESFGLKLEKMLPMKFDAYYVSMLSEKYKGGSLLKAVLNGWKSNRRAGKDKWSSQIYIFRKK